jgi:hypothetical protein
VNRARAKRTRGCGFDKLIVVAVRMVDGHGSGGIHAEIPASGRDQLFQVFAGEQLLLA